LAISLLYLLAAFVATRHFLQARHGIAQDVPTVSVLKPVRGNHSQLAQALTSSVRQHYPHYQVVFGVECDSDTSLPIIRKIAQENPQCDISVVVGDPDKAAGSNGKIRTLCQMYPYAKHDIVVISDSDMLFTPEYLAAVAAPFQDKKVGAVTCLYHSVGGNNLAAAWEACAIDLNFVPSVMVARSLSEISFAFGATMAVRRHVLEQIGGLAALSDYLADDYQLGNRVFRQGYKVVLSDYVVASLNHMHTFRDYFLHQLRWARTYRICRPYGYFFSLITHTVSLSVLFACFAPAWPLALSWLGIVLGVRWALACGYMRLGLHAAEYRRYLWTLPLFDLLSTLLWSLAFIGDTVVWGGQRFRVLCDGRMTPLSRKIKCLS
jgi:ceramide glucosyltransferase